MAAAAISPRKRRSAILATGLADLEGFAMVVDCLTADCAGARRVLIRDLAGVYGRQQTVAEALRRYAAPAAGGRQVLRGWWLVRVWLAGASGAVAA